jgi:hypothetical protein
MGYDENASFVEDIDSEYADLPAVRRFTATTYDCATMALDLRFVRASGGNALPPEKWQVEEG